MKSESWLKVRAWLTKPFVILSVLVTVVEGVAKTRLPERSAHDTLITRTSWMACPASPEETRRAIVFTKDDSTSCPQLAVSVDADGDPIGVNNTSVNKISLNRPRLWRLLSQSGLTRPYSEAELRWIAPSTLRGRPWAVLDSPVVALAPTRNPGVSWPVQTPGFVIGSGNDSTAPDTVPLLQFKLRADASRPATTAAACFDSLAAVGVRGLVSGASVPLGLCRFTVQGAAAGSQELCGSALTAGRAPDGSWAFAEVNCVTRPRWMVRSLRHSDPIVLDFIDSLPGEPVAIAGADLNGDGVVEILVESRHHYPDGMYSQLRVAVDEKKGWRVSQPLPLSDASGEGEGDATTVTWRLASKRLPLRFSPGAKRMNALPVCVETVAPGSSQASFGKKRISAPPIAAYFLQADGHWRAWAKKPQVRNLCATGKSALPLGPDNSP